MYWVRNDDPDCTGHDAGEAAGDPAAFYPEVCKLQADDAAVADGWYAKHHPGWTAKMGWAQHDREQAAWQAVHPAPTEILSPPAETHVESEAEFVRHTVTAGRALGSGMDDSTLRLLAQELYANCYDDGARSHEAFARCAVDRKSRFAGYVQAHQSSF